MFYFSFHSVTAKIIEFAFWFEKGFIVCRIASSHDFFKWIRFYNHLE